MPQLNRQRNEHPAGDQQTKTKLINPEIESGMLKPVKTREEKKLIVFIAFFVFIELLSATGHSLNTLSIFINPTNPMNQTHPC